jgi:hypothetical protein
MNSGMYVVTDGFFAQLLMRFVVTTLSRRWSAARLGRSAKQEWFSARFIHIVKEQDWRWIHSTTALLPSSS